MTSSEIVDLVFTRNVDERSFTEGDIRLATNLYVDRYIYGYDTSSAYYSDFVKPVIAYGTVVMCFARFISEVSDRGLVEMLSEGARAISEATQSMVLKEYEEILFLRIQLMVQEAEKHGVMTINDDLAVYNRIGYSKMKTEMEI